MATAKFKLAGKVEHERQGKVFHEVQRPKSTEPVSNKGVKRGDRPG
jgi:hypothetical protein